MSFNRVWSRFLGRRHTLGPTPGVRERWHQGRRWFHVSALLLDAPELTARVEQTFQPLAPFLEPFSARTPHVTCFVHGFADPAHVPPLPAEGEEVELRVGGANAFASCVFLEVRSARLRELRTAFPAGEHRWSAYRPHITVGLFRAAVPTAAIVPRLRALRALSTINLRGRLTTCFLDASSSSGHLHRQDEIHS